MLTNCLSEIISGIQFKLFGKWNIRTLTETTRYGDIYKGYILKNDDDEWVVSCLECDLEVGIFLVLDSSQRLMLGTTFRFYTKIAVKWGLFLNLYLKNYLEYYWKNKIFSTTKYFLRNTKIFETYRRRNVS